MGNFKLLKKLLSIGISKEKIRRADLSGANLPGANLSWANLSGANLSWANLYGANLSGADLYGANLSGANLYEANLYGANLSGANLRGANLSGTNLRGANLSGTNLPGANLSGANLYGANLSWANLYGANLSGANLSGANLSGANLSGADLSNVKISESTFGITINCPEVGSFYAYKRAQGFIILLLIPVSGKRSSATTYKCRCDKAKVIEIQNIDGSKSDLLSVKSDYDNSFIYEVGKVVKVNDFNEDRWIECGTGIHFFMNRQMAVQYC